VKATAHMRTKNIARTANPKKFSAKYSNSKSEQQSFDVCWMTKSHLRRLQSQQLAVAAQSDGKRINI